jgi:hypothetical protein
MTAVALRQWVHGYVGPLRLAVSSGGADGLPVADPLPLETGLRAYAHIDATGTLKRTSFDADGVVVGPDGIVSALQVLKALGTRPSAATAGSRGGRGAAIVGMPGRRSPVLGVVDLQDLLWPAPRPTRPRRGEHR